MADWDALRSYIKANYEVADDNVTSVRLVFARDGGRSQSVFVRSIGTSGWAEIGTIVCRESDISPRDALLRNLKMTVGGLALSEGKAPGEGSVIFRHTFPLANLDPDEFDEPLAIAVNYGDDLERELTGADRF